MKNERADRSFDSSNYGHEPIHTDGSIQPHGVLLGIDETSFIIELVSDNVFEKLGLAPEDILQQDFSSIFDETSQQLMLDGIRSLAYMLPCEPFEIQCRGKSLAHRMHASIHRSSGLLVMELEDIVSSPCAIFEKYHLRLGQTIAGMRKLKNTDEICHQVIQEVKYLTAFDRVMLYRFDSEGNGRVIAEAKEPELETFLGLHYPAANIPEHDRHLYSISSLQLVPNRNYKPAQLIPALSPRTGEPMDLSHSVLRSASPTHLQSLRNMGVRASMSVSLLQDGRLWGLIACYHAMPKHVSYDVRLACESLAQILAWQISSQERYEDTTRRSTAMQLMSDILTRAAAEPSLIQGLWKCSNDLLRLVDATGVALKYRGQVATAGVTPSEDAIQQLIQWLQFHKKTDVYASHKLPWEFLEARNFSAIASGMIAIRISSQDDFIIWFRPEHVTTLDWFVHSDKPAQGVRDRFSLSGSIAFWQQTVNWQSQPWLGWQIDAATCFLYLLVLRIVKEAEEKHQRNREFQYAGQAKDELLAMVARELRTPLNSMIGWMHMIRGGLLHESEYQEAYETIERHAYDQLRLIEDLLEISWIGRDKPHGAKPVLLLQP